MIKKFMRRLVCVSILCSSMIGLGCGSAQPARSAISTLVRSDPPPRLELLRKALSARHSSALPSHAHIKKIDESERGLMWLGLYGNPLNIRVRALSVLGELSSDDSLQMLLQSVGMAKRPSLKAAALRALKGRLAGLSPTDPRRAQIIAIARQAAHSSDRRIAESVRALGEIAPELREIAPKLREIDLPSDDIKSSE